METQINVNAIQYTAESLSFAPAYPTIEGEIKLPTTATKPATQNFEVTGSIQFQINAKEKFLAYEIAKIEADLIVGKDSHLLIADEDITVSWDESNKLATVSLPIIFNKKTTSESKAITYAKKILTTIDKIEAKIEFRNGKEKNFKSLSSIIEWENCTQVNLQY